MKRLGKYITESILDTTTDTDMLVGVFKDGEVTQEVANEVFESDVEEITLPEGVVCVYMEAFYGRKKLRKVVLPSTLDTIWRSAFEGCENLEEVVFHPNTKQLKNIGNRAFFGCTKLRKLDLPDCVARVGEEFIYNSGIIDIHIPTNLKIFTRAFQDLKYVKSIDLSHTHVDEIPKNAFKEATGLREVILPSTCTTVRMYAFNGCSNLKKVSARNVKLIGQDAFNSCTSLKEVQMPKVRRIGFGAFENCTSLTTVEFANGVSLGDSAFSKCSSLKEFNTPVSNVDTAAFSGSGVSEIYWLGRGEISKSLVIKPYISNSKFEPPIKKVHLMVPETRLSAKSKKCLDWLKKCANEKKIELILPE